MEEMNELFCREPYCSEFDSCVVSCREDHGLWLIELEDTAFYPEGGGQPADHGTLNDIAVSDVQRKDGVILHTCVSEIPVGTAVHGVIDWERRFDHMQNHTGEHIVSGLVHAKYGYDNVGFHMGDLIQIDFDGQLNWDQLMEIERQANAVIWKNEAVEISFPTDEDLHSLDYRSKKELSGRVRIVTIPSGDVCACCGTHVARTGEVGLIKILSCTKHKQGVRVEMLSGRRALACMDRIYDENARISVALSAKIPETSASVQQLLEANAKKDQAYRELNRRFLALKEKSYEDGAALVCDFEEGMDRTSMVNFANHLVEDREIGVAAILNHEENGYYSYVIISLTKDLKSFSKSLNEKLNGRGGGRSEILQGSFQSDEETIRTVLSETFN